MSLPYGLSEENLPLVGEGSQGKVYLLDANRCVKIYKRPEFLPLELDILLKAAGEPQFPKVYEWGPGYMIREYVPGIDLREYLRKNPLTENISRQIAELFLAFERLQFRRLDTRFAHLIITPEGIVKAIDPANAMRKSGSYPKKFLAQMEKMKCKKLFFQHLWRHYPQLYEKWAKN